MELLSHSSIPTVVIGNPKNDVILSVDNNNVLAMQTVVKELINAGKTKIAFIGGNMNFTVTDERLKGYKNALLDFGIAISYENIYYTDFSISSGFELAHSLIYKNYDAIVCTDDLIAVGIANKYEQINKKCVITGFNNTYYAQMSKIPICSVDINVHELGKQAVRLLNSAIEANIKEDVLEIRRVIVDTNLIRKEILWQN